ncbi:MAG: PEP-CTERM sorting domain-containing protein [Pseudomonadota bacterium]
MRGFSKLIGGVVGLAFLAMAGTAQASLIQNLTVTDNQDGGGFTGTGRIEFDSLSGNSAAGVVSFSFTPSTNTPNFDGSPPVFTEADIISVSWLIEDWELVEFSLVAGDMISTPFGGSTWGIVLDLTNELVRFPCFSAVSVPASLLCGPTSGVISVAGRDLSTEPVHNDIPEPASLALFAIALGGLGFMARRRVT